MNALPPPRVPPVTKIIARSLASGLPAASPAPTTAAAGQALLASTRFPEGSVHCFAWLDSSSGHTYEYVYRVRCRRAPPLASHHSSSSPYPAYIFYRRYWISRPVQQHGRSYVTLQPLLLALHGDGRERGAKSSVHSLRSWGPNRLITMTTSAYTPNAVVQTRALLRSRFVVVTPQHPSTPCVWDMEAVQRLTVHLCTTWSALIDTNQLFLAGVSMGASTAWEVALAQAMATPTRGGGTGGGGAAAQASVNCGADPHADPNSGCGFDPKSGSANTKKMATPSSLAGMFAAFVSVAGFIPDNAKATLR